VENNPEWFKEKEEKVFTKSDMISFAEFIQGERSRGWLSIGTMDEIFSRWIKI